MEAVEEETATDARRPLRVLLSPETDLRLRFTAARERRRLSHMANEAIELYLRNREQAKAS